MSYSKDHTENECDKCLKDVGKENLVKVKFLYLDRNDHVHQELGEIYGPQYRHYRQYYICKECAEKER